MLHQPENDQQHVNTTRIPKKSLTEPTPNPYQAIPGQTTPLSALGVDQGSEKRGRFHNSQPREGDMEQVDIRFLVLADLAGGVIGKGGKVITSFRQESGAGFVIHKEVTDSPVRTGTASGNVVAIVKALGLLSDKTRDLSRNESQNPQWYTTILLEQKNCGCVIGPKGAKITATRLETGATIQLSTHPLTGSTEKTIEVHGTRDQVAAATEIIVRQIATDPGKFPVVQKYLDDSHSGGFGAPLPPNRTPANSVRSYRGGRESSRGGRGRGGNNESWTTTTVRPPHQNQGYNNYNPQHNSSFPPHNNHGPGPYSQNSGGPYAPGGIHPGRGGPGGPGPYGGHNSNPHGSFQGAPPHQNRQYMPYNNQRR